MTSLANLAVPIMDGYRLLERALAMWYELGMRLIDGLPYYSIMDLIVLLLFITSVLAFGLYLDNRDKKKRIEELENLVDYYYNEDLIK